MKEVVVKVSKLHKAQKYIYKNKKRFNVVCCGRRFGKTTLCEYILVKETLLKEKQFYAYYAPTYVMLDEVWGIVLNSLEDVILSKNSNFKSIKLINGSTIKFWSLEKIDSSRGRKYHKVIIDEAASVRKLKEAWYKVIRATLTDYRGEAWFMSTPKTYHNDFYYFSQKSKTKSNWTYFNMPSSANPHISKEELEEIKSELPTKVYLQEYDAQFVNFEGNTFIEYFDESIFVKGLEVDKREVLYLSFDFNIVNTCIVFQHNQIEIKVLKEYHIKEYDLEDLCKQIVFDFPNMLYFVTGDASGNSRSALTKGNVSAYQLIKGYLNLTNKVINTPASNPSHLNSRLLTNFIIKKANIKIDDSCKLLKKDFELVVCSKNGAIDKTDENLTHLLDAFRYYLWTYHYQTFLNLSKINNLV